MDFGVSDPEALD